jgi:general nucleoside transport system permease protein
MMKTPSWIQIERRPSPSGLTVFAISVIGIIVALIVAGLFFQLYGVSAIRAYGDIIKGALGSRLGLTETIRGMIPLLVIGVGLTVAFRAQFWNIGAEGQLLMGAVAGAGIALFSGIPAPWLIPAMFIGGFIAGALWGVGPAILKAKLGINDVITTLMLNYVAIYVVHWLILGPWKGPTQRGFPYTDRFPPAAFLQTLGSTRIHLPTLAIGLAAAIVLYLVVKRTRVGFEIRVVGENPDAAKYAGISQTKITVLAMVISGGLAGIAGVGEVAGIHHMLFNPSSIALSYGYTAIIVAWLARRNPLAVILTSFLFGVIMRGGDVIKISLGLPFQLVNVFNGLILFFLIGSEILIRYRIRLGTKKESP